MAQHFLPSAKARSLSLAKVMRMTEDEAYAAFRAIRWADGEAVCPRCGGYGCYEYKARRIFKCRACRHQFSATSGTLFASRKLPMRDYLAAIAIFVNGAKGVSALQLSRDLNCQYRTALVLAHKLREAIAGEQPHKVAGEVEIDGAYFGGYVMQANRRENRVDRRRSIHKSGKRKCVVVMRERQGRTLPVVVQHKRRSLPFIRKAVQPGSIVYADEAPGWDDLHTTFVSRRPHEPGRVVLRPPAPCGVWAASPHLRYVSRQLCDRVGLARG